MDIKLCRICGKQDDNYIHIFKTEGLKNKIETCLPIVISRGSPLPDTICNPCLDSVDNFYCFIKNCLQNIIVLEAQYEIIESCLKTKRKVDKSVLVGDSDFTSDKIDVSIDSTIKSEFVKTFTNFNLKPSVSDNINLSSTKDDSQIPNFSCSLVDYDSSDENSDEDSKYDQDFVERIKQKTDENKIKLECSNQTIKIKEECVNDNTQSTVVEPEQNNIINEIVQRKYLKRKSEDVLSNVSKIARLECESSSRRKNKQPKRVEYHLEAKIEKKVAPIVHNYATSEENLISEKLLNLPAEISVTREVTEVPILPIQEPMQTCLLCEQQFFGPIPLTTHMYETHGIDLAQVFAAAQPTSSEKPSPKKKIPNLVKISDVMSVRKQLPQENYDEPPVLEPQAKIPLSALHKNYTCAECDGSIVYTTFKDYSNHRRSQHQIFHCDLCPKFYGRNSHLWKHVNRVHKGHPSITCQQCYKTSASKYHLAQHFNKMHSVKTQKPKPNANVNKNNSGYITPEENDEEFMNQKFQGFDFKSVRQSFLRQDILDKQKYVSILKKNEDEETSSVISNRDDSIKKDTHSDRENCKKEIKRVKKNEIKSEPKEIDSSSNLYTNIITNYTPPSNEGAFKCPKCFKGFHKKNLLKKHKKNCRPRLQKDLLTRCKTCSRIFKDRQSLAKHLINYHSEYTCEICNLAVQSKCEIVSHIRFSHPNSELTCHCGQILRSKSDLQKHKIDHRDSHVCQFCGDTLPTKIKLKMHILSLHRKILSLSCGICLKLFETQHILRDHVRLVHGDQLSPLTSCTVCGKNYGSKWKTYDHLNKSHGRIFKACKACLEVFETEQELQKHFEVDHLNSKNSLEKKVTTGEKKGNSSPDRHEPLPDFHPPDDNSTSDEDDEETSGESSGIQNPKTLQDDLEYRNYIIREFQSNLEKKTGQNGLGVKSESKKSENLSQKSHDAKLSLLEKRLLGKKLTDEDLKAAQKSEGKNKSKNSDILENGNKVEKSEKKKHSVKHDKLDEDPMQNSSKRTVYVNSNDPSLCEICLKVWPAKKHLWQHYIRCHKQVAATVCGICLKTNSSYASLQTHLRETHPNLLYGCGFGSNFICKICGRYHNASSKLKLHMAIHVGFSESMLENFNDMKEMPTLEQEKPQSDVESSESDIELTEHIKEEQIEVKEEQIEEIEEIDHDDQDHDDQDHDDQDHDDQDHDDQDHDDQDHDDQDHDDQDHDDQDHDDQDHNVQDRVDQDRNNQDLDDQDHDEQDHDEIDDMNYESLIEEVEVSSESETEFNNEDNVYSVTSKQSEEQDISSSDEDEGESEPEDSDNEGTENELEQEMLKNMIGENVTIVTQDEENSNGSQHSSYQSGDYELGLKEELIDDDNNYDVDSCNVKMEVCSADDWTNSPKFVSTIKHIKTDDDKIVLFHHKELELDSAIQSIAYEEEVVTTDHDFSDVNPGLNESELETAVGSIL